MAKEQRRGNKETKKPKKVKAPVAAPTTLTRGISASAPQPPKTKKG